MSKVKIQVTTAVAVTKALEDRWSLKPVSDKDAKIVWEWLIDNEPELFKKVHALRNASDAAKWRDKIREALYGNNTRSSN